MTRAALGAVACVVASTMAVPRAAGEDRAALEKGCAAGKTEDCTSLGLVYWLGDGVERNRAIATSFFDKARDLYKQACDGGNTFGCFKLGDLYENGAGVPKDAPRAAALFKQACERGLSEACVRLEPSGK